MPDDRVRRTYEARRKLRILYLGATVVSFFSSCNQRLPGKRGDFKFCPHCRIRLGEPGRGAISTGQFLVLLLVLALVTLVALYVN